MRQVHYDHSIWLRAALCLLSAWFNFDLKKSHCLNWYFQIQYCSMLRFTAKIQVIGINPYVLLPHAVLTDIFQRAGKDKGAIPVKLNIAGQDFMQHLVRYSGKWRLYLNTPMRKAAQKDVGDTIVIKIDFDPKERTTPIHPKLKLAFSKNKEAKKAFDTLNPSRQKEILRYINNLKSEETIVKNIERALAHLAGKSSFVGRPKK